MRIWILLKVSFLTETRLWSLRNIDDDFYDEEPQTDVSSVMFTDICEKVAYFRVCRRLLNVQHCTTECGWDGNIIEMAQRSTHVSIRRFSARIHIPRMTVLFSELATAFTGSHSARFLCEESDEKHPVWTQVVRKVWTASADFRCCKTRQLHLSSS
jgi:hypothetical protein